MPPTGFTVRRAQRRGQGSDGGVLVDVLHRHRRQIRPLPHPGTELRHHQGISTQIIEEMTAHRYPVDLQDAGQYLGKRPFGDRPGSAEFARRSNRQPSRQSRRRLILFPRELP